MLRRLKPKLKDINIQNLKPEQLIFFCKTQVIDKKIVLLKGGDFNQELADEMEKPYPFYFIVKSDMTYDIVSGLLFEEFIKTNNISELPESEKSKKCINDYIRKMK